MDNTTTENKKRFLQNDRLLVCSLLMVYALCLFGFTGAVYWVMNRGREFTAGQQANATATAVARATEQSQFEIVEHFDKTLGQWQVGKYKNHRGWDGSLEITEGTYVWTIDKVQRPFLDEVEFFQSRPVKDFDVYLDTRWTGGTVGNSCSGLVFRRSFQGWAHGAYVFMLCSDSTFNVSYYDGSDWESFSGKRFNDTILPLEWNQIEVSSRGEIFKFSINHKVVYQLTDDRQAEGALGILVQICDTTPTTFLFDNFGYQSR